MSRLTANTRPASIAQLQLIHRLATERPAWQEHLNGGDYERVFDVMTNAGKFVGLNEARSAIQALFEVPKPRPQLRPTGEDAVTEPGMYRSPEGHIYKVQLSRESKKLYAKRLMEISGQRLTDEGEVVRFEFVYDRGAIFTLAAHMRMSLEEAKAFGIQYGVCCWCGATLKDAKSVAAGIGPVCAGRV